MKTKHTPGPWMPVRWSCNADTAVSSANGIVVCETSGLGRHTDSCIPDARLIAAAPELLDALKLFKRHIGGDATLDIQTILHAVDSAIAKAEGS